MSLSDTEQEILEKLASHGASSAGRLAKLTRIKRPTIYAALARLLDLGIVLSLRSRGTAVFQALPPGRVKQILIDRAQRDFESSKREAGDVELRLKVVSDNAPHRLSGYEFDALDSREGVHEELRSILVAGNYVAFFDPQTVLRGVTKEMVRGILEQSAKTKPPIREICVAGPLCDWYISTIRNERHEVRLMQENAKIPTDIIITRDSVILLHYEMGSELALRIRQSDYVSSMKGLFEEFWRNAKDRAGKGRPLQLSWEL